MADQKINALPVKTAPTTGDKMLMIGAAEEYQIDYDQLATAILNKLTSKTYALDQGTKTLIAALNELNSKTYYAAYTKGKNIPENADLNDYLNTGVYYVRDSDIAETIKNYPPGVSAGGRLEVCELASDWKHQNFYPNNSADIYIRFSNSYPWYKITAQQLQSE